VFTTTRHWTLSWTRCIQPTTSHRIHKIHSNIILPSTPRSSEWSLPSQSCNDRSQFISQLQRPEKSDQSLCVKLSTQLWGFLIHGHLRTLKGFLLLIPVYWFTVIRQCDLPDWILAFHTLTRPQFASTSKIYCTHEGYVMKLKLSDVNCLYLSCKFAPFELLLSSSTCCYDISNSNEL
jgi:hypothetical protein